jgi:hypothetical protein
MLMAKQTWRRSDGQYLSRRRPERDHEVAAAVWVEGLTLKQAADRFGISMRWVSVIAWRPQFAEMRREAMG